MFYFITLYLHIVNRWTGTVQNERII